MTEPESINKVNQSNNIVESGDMAGRDIIKPVTNINIGRVSFGGKSQLELLYEKLEQEKQNSTVFCEMVEELMHFKSYAVNTEVIGLEKKLENGNRLRYLNFAEKAKEKFTKKLLKNEHSETAQHIYAFLLAKVYSRFETHIYPRLNEGHPEEYINHLGYSGDMHPLIPVKCTHLLNYQFDKVILFFLNCLLLTRFYALCELPCL